MFIFCWIISADEALCRVAHNRYELPCLTRDSNGAVLFAFPNVIYSTAFRCIDFALIIRVAYGPWWAFSALISATVITAGFTVTIRGTFASTAGAQASAVTGFTAFAYAAESAASIWTALFVFAFRLATR